MSKHRREQIEAAMMRHPSTYHARQQQSDPINTAQEFHTYMGAKESAPWYLAPPPWQRSHSRPRKAKLFDAMSVVLLVALIAAAITLEWLIVTGSWPR